MLTWPFLLLYQKESAAALTQLSKMREQLDKKQADFGGPYSDENSSGPATCPITGPVIVGAGNPHGRRESGVWNGLAEIWDSKLEKLYFAIMEQWDKQ